MAQYIDKSALIAEIERRKQVAFGWLVTAPNDAIQAEFDLCDDILSFLDTLEVKDVDLNEEIEKCLKRHSMLAVGKKDFTDIAKHFFELGMQVSNKAQKGE